MNREKVSLRNNFDNVPQIKQYYEENYISYKKKSRINLIENKEVVFEIAEIINKIKNFNQMTFRKIKYYIYESDVETKGMYDAINKTSLLTKIILLKQIV